jgi:ankyrin repeat protein
MKKIHILLTFLFACNILGAAASNEQDNAVDYGAFFGAIERNDIEGVQGFLKQGANVHSRNFYGRTPLFEALCHRHKELVEIFLEWGSDINVKDSLFELTPLIRATMDGCIELMRLLLAKGADVNAQDRDGDIALHHAAYGGREEVAKVLLEWGAHKDAKNDWNDAAAEDARRHGHHELAQFIESWEPLEIKEPGDD